METEDLLLSYPSLSSFASFVAGHAPTASGMPRFKAHPLRVYVHPRVIADESSPFSFPEISIYFLSPSTPSTFLAYQAHLLPHSIPHFSRILTRSSTSTVHLQPQLSHLLASSGSPFPDLHRAQIKEYITLINARRSMASLRGSIAPGGVTRKVEMPNRDVVGTFPRLMKEGEEAKSGFGKKVWIWKSEREKGEVMMREDDRKWTEEDERLTEWTYDVVDVCPSSRFILTSRTAC
jgi:hypothetical protein